MRSAPSPPAWRGGWLRRANEWAGERGPLSALLRVCPGVPQAAPARTPPVSVPASSGGPGWGEPGGALNFEMNLSLGQARDGFLLKSQFPWPSHIPPHLPNALGPPQVAPGWTGAQASSCPLGARGQRVAHGQLSRHSGDSGWPVASSHGTAGAAAPERLEQACSSERDESQGRSSRNKPQAV